MDAEASGDTADDDALNTVFLRFTTSTSLRTVALQPCCQEVMDTSQIFLLKANGVDTDSTDAWCFTVSVNDSGTVELDQLPVVKMAMEDGDNETVTLASDLITLTREERRTFYGNDESWQHDDV